MKFNNYLILVLLVLLPNHCKSMEDDINPFYLPAEVWKNVQRYLFHSTNHEEIGNLFRIGSHQLISNTYQLLGEVSVSAFHWHLLSKNIVPKMFNDITNGKASNDGSFIIYRVGDFAEADHGIFIFDIKLGTKKKLFSESSLTNGSRCAVNWVLSNSNTFIAYEQNGDFYSYDIQNGISSYIAKSKQSIITSLSVSPDDTKIIVCYKTDQVVIHDMNGEKSVSYLPASNALTSVILSPDNNYLVAVENEYVINVTEINVLNPETMEHLYSITRPKWTASSAISQVSIDTTSQLLFLRTAENAIATYNMLTGELISSHTKDSAAILGSDAINVDTGCSNYMVSSSLLDQANNSYQLIIAQRIAREIVETDCDRLPGEQSDKIVEISRHTYFCAENVYGKLVKLSKDTSMAIIALSDGSIKLFDLQSGRHITYKNPYLKLLDADCEMQEAKLDSKCFIPKSLFISDDNKRIVIIMASGTIIWEVEDCLEMLANNNRIPLNLLPATSNQRSTKCTIL